MLNSFWLMITRASSASSSPLRSNYSRSSNQRSSRQVVPHSPHWLSERELEGVQRTKDKLSSLYVNNHNESELIRVFEGSFPQQHCCHINTQAFVAYSGLPVVYKEGWVYDSSSEAEKRVLCTMRGLSTMMAQE